MTFAVIIVSHFSGNGCEFQILTICRLFNKLVLEAPLITESALEVIRRYCEDEVTHIDAKVFSVLINSWSYLCIGFRYKHLNTI